jgi:hypothetical protein
MTIETKYKIGDVVWFQTLGINYNAKITRISIDIFPDGKNIINYNLHYKGYNYERHEDELSPSKEELLKNLV